MKLILVRHAIAAEREVWTGTDSARPLTDRGRKRMHAAAAGLHSLVKSVDSILSSPYVRAYQTAEILVEHYPKSDLEERQELTAGCSGSEVEEMLKEYDPKSSIILTGHEPDFSCLISYFLNGDEVSRAAVKKGSAVLIEFSAGALEGRGTLQWLIPPAVLRRLS